MLGHRLGKFLDSYISLWKINIVPHRNNLMLIFIKICSFLSWITFNTHPTIASSVSQQAGIRPNCHATRSHYTQVRGDLPAVVSYWYPDAEELAALRSPTCGVMIARGDFAVECGFERMAEVQDDRTRNYLKPVVYLYSRFEYGICKVYNMATFQ